EKKPEDKTATSNPEQKQPEQKQNEDADGDFQQRGRGAGAAAAAGRSSGARKEYGSDLVLRNLSDGSERTFADALEYSFSKDAKTRIYPASAKKEEPSGVFAVTPGEGAARAELLSGKGRYSKITGDEKQRHLAFISAHDEGAKKEQEKGAPAAK